LQLPQGLELTCQRLDVLHVTYPNAPSVQDEEEREGPLLAVDYQIALGALTLSYEDPEGERINVSGSFDIQSRSIPTGFPLRKNRRKS